MASLYLKPYDDEQDFHHIVRMNMNPEAMRYIRPVETEEGPVRVRINHTLAKCPPGSGMGIFMILDSETHKVLGNCIVRHADWDPSRELEIGYVIDPIHWGKGYASTAVSLLLAHVQATFGPQLVVAFTDLENVGSHRVLQKNGFKNTGNEEIYGTFNIRWEFIFPSSNETSH